MDEQKDLNKALNLGLFGLVGIFIPIIGLILSLVSLSLASGIPTDKDTRGKKHTIRVVGVIGITLSLVLGIIYSVAYFEQKERVEAEQRSQARIQLEAERAVETKRVEQQAAQDQCLTQAGDRYNQYLENNASRTEVGANGQTSYYLPHEQGAWAEAKLTSDQNGCYERYPVQ